MALTKLPKSGLGSNSVDASKIEDGVIQAVELASTVSGAKIKDGEIANAKLVNSSISFRGTSRALGTSFTVHPELDWQAVVTSDGSTVTTLEASKGYFIDNSSAAGTVKLPTSASAGDTIAIKDYAGNFATNKLTIQRNGHKIQGVENNSLIGTNRAALELVYVDATKGWLYTTESNVGDLRDIQYIAATGGTEITTGDFKVHVFTGDGNFVVSNAGNSAGSNIVDYLVVAGGGGGAKASSGGGGAGGFRMFVCGSPNPLNAPAGLPVPAQTYPVTVGAGGPGGSPGCSSADVTKGSNSVFSTITSAGGGGGGPDGGTGGSGKGGEASCGAGSAGNTPPVSPPQGNAGGQGRCQSVPGGGASGGGGGAGATGGNAPPGPNNPAGAGGAGSFVPNAFIGPTAPSYGEGGPVSSTRYFAGGGGGGTYIKPSSNAGGGVGGGGDGSGAPGPNGTNASANTGGGGGGGFHPGGLNGAGTNGGKGIVIIRYKFQN